MTLTLTPFKAEDGVAILGTSAEPLLDWLLRAECSGPAYTGTLADGTILGAAGITLESQEIGNAWMLPSRHVPDYPKLFHATVRRAFRDVLRSHPALRYITAHTDKDFPTRDAWITRIGFVRVGSVDVLWPTPTHVHLFGYLVRNGHGGT